MKRRLPTRLTLSTAAIKLSNVIFVALLCSTNTQDNHLKRNSNMVSSGKDYGLPARAGATKFDMDSMVHLETVSDEVCRKILTTLCNDPKIKERVFSCLWLYKDKDQKTHSIASAAQEGPSTGIDDGTKRKAEASLPDAYMCRYCGDDFLEEDNTDPEACSHHPGRPRF